MRRRSRMSRRSSRKNFTRHSGIHRKNHNFNPSRGGIRL